MIELDFEEIDVHELDRAVELEVVMSAFEASKLVEAFQETFVKNIMSRFSKLAEEDITFEDSENDESDSGHSISKRIVFSEDMDWIPSVYPDRVEEALDETWDEVFGGLDE